jgi:head-tail adaptor
MIKAGNLNAMVDFQNDSGTKNDYGETVPNWQNIHTGIWCLWESVTGSDEYVNHQKASKQKIKVRLNYTTELSNVSGTSRVVRDSKNYRIIGEPSFSGYRGISIPDVMELELVRFDNE